jgi:hypothetical protein
MKHTEVAFETERRAPALRVDARQFCTLQGRSAMHTARLEGVRPFPAAASRTFSITLEETRIAALRTFLGPRPVFPDELVLLRYRSAPHGFTQSWSSALRT